MYNLTWIVWQYIIFLLCQETYFSGHTYGYITKHAIVHIKILIWLLQLFVKNVCAPSNHWHLIQLFVKNVCAPSNQWHLIQLFVKNVFAPSNQWHIIQLFVKNVSAPSNQWHLIQLFVKNVCAPSNQWHIIQLFVKNVCAPSNQWHLPSTTNHRPANAVMIQITTQYIGLVIYIGNLCTVILYSGLIQEMTNNLPVLMTHMYFL